MFVFLILGRIWYWNTLNSSVFVLIKSTIFTFMFLFRSIEVVMNISFPFHASLQTLFKFFITQNNIRQFFYKYFQRIFSKFEQYLYCCWVSLLFLLCRKMSETKTKRPNLYLSVVKIRWNSFCLNSQTSSDTTIPSSYSKNSPSISSVLISSIYCSEDLVFFEKFSMNNTFFLVLRNFYQEKRTIN